MCDMTHSYATPRLPAFSSPYPPVFLSPCPFYSSVPLPPHPSACVAVCVALQNVLLQCVLRCRVSLPQRSPASASKCVCVAVCDALQYLLLQCALRCSMSSLLVFLCLRIHSHFLTHHFHLFLLLLQHLPQYVLVYSSLLVLIALLFSYLRIHLHFLISTTQHTLHHTLQHTLQHTHTFSSLQHTLQSTRTFSSASRL